MAIRFEAILPKRFHNSKTAKDALDRLLKGFQVEAQRELQKYPPWQPWKSEPPRTGPRAGGRRTGTLGRNWSSFRLVSGKSITLENKTGYGRFVQGGAGEQARHMAARGWKRVDEVGRSAARRAIDSWKPYG